MGTFSLHNLTFDESLPRVTEHFAQEYRKWETKGQPLPLRTLETNTEVGAALLAFKAHKPKGGKPAKWKPHMRMDYELHGAWRTPDVTFRDLPETIEMVTRFKGLLPVANPDATLIYGKGLVASGTVTLRVGEQHHLASPPRIQGDFTLRGETLYIALQAYALPDKKG